MESRSETGVFGRQVEDWLSHRREAVLWRSGKLLIFWTERWGPDGRKP